MAATEETTSTVALPCLRLLPAATSDGMMKIDALPLASNCPTETTSDVAPMEHLAKMNGPSIATSVALDEMATSTSRARVLFNTNDAIAVISAPEEAM